MMITLRQLALHNAEASGDRGLGLLNLLVAAGGKLTQEDARAWYRGENRRLELILAKLRAHGCISGNLSNALVLQALRLPRLHPLPAGLQSVLAFPDDLADAASPIERFTGITAAPLPRPEPARAPELSSFRASEALASAPAFSTRLQAEAKAQAGPAADQRTRLLNMVRRECPDSDWPRYRESWRQLIQADPDFVEFSLLKRLHNARAEGRPIDNGAAWMSVIARDDRKWPQRSP